MFLENVAITRLSYKQGLFAKKSLRNYFKTARHITRACTRISLFKFSSASPSAFKKSWFCKFTNVLRSLKAAIYVSHQQHVCDTAERAKANPKVFWTFICHLRLTSQQLSLSVVVQLTPHKRYPTSLLTTLLLLTTVRLWVPWESQCQMYVDLNYLHHNPCLCMQMTFDQNFPGYCFRTKHCRRQSPK